MYAAARPEFIDWATAMEVDFRPASGRAIAGLAQGHDSAQLEARTGARFYGVEEYPFGCTGRLCGGRLLDLQLWMSSLKSRYSAGVRAGSSIQPHRSNVLYRWCTEALSNSGLKWANGHQRVAQARKMNPRWITRRNQGKGRAGVGYLVNRPGPWADLGSQASLTLRVTRP